MSEKYMPQEIRHLHLNKFAEYLRQKTTLGELSIQLYSRTIGHFLRTLKGDRGFSIKQVNNYLTKNYRQKHKPYVKYAFKHYFNYLNKGGRYKELIKVRIPSRRKKGNFVPRPLLIKVINHIKPKVYRDIAMLQYATGCRGREVLTLHEADIDLFFEDSSIRIRIQGKGDKVRFSYLIRDFEIMLKKYMGRGYLFLPKRFNEIKDEDLWKFSRQVSTFMTYYFNALSNSALDFGILNFGTHDLRRNAADSFRKKFKDVYLVKQILGHSNIGTTEKYFDDNPENIKEAVLGHQKG